MESNECCAGGADEHDFEFWWEVAGDWVEPPNERRNGWSGMLRVRLGDTLYYVKRQRNHLCRTLRHPLGWPTASREWHYLKLLRDLGLAVPVPVFHGVRRAAQGVEAVLVTEELQGYAALSEQVGLDSHQYAALAHEIGMRLGILHRARLQHSCLYDKHIMVRWRADAPEIALIDLEKMRLRLRASAAARHDLEQLQRRQAVLGPEAWEKLEGAHEAQFSGAGT